MLNLEHGGFNAVDSEMFQSLLRNQRDPNKRSAIYCCIVR